MSKGFGLDANNDLLIRGTGFVRTETVEHIAQKIRSKLQLIEGESQLDPEAGIPYFSEIFVKPVDLDAVISLFKTEIMTTEGVNELLLFDYSLDRTQRELTISFSVNTIYGELTLNSLTLNIGV